MELSKEEVGKLYGRFTWTWGKEFFIETSEGNFIYSDPDYGGDNTLRSVDASYKEWSEPYSFGRDKGRHYITDFCGESFQLL